jgi:hypothetical protein
MEKTMRPLLSICAVAMTLLMAPLHAKDKSEINPDAPLTVSDFVKVKGKGKLTGVKRVAIPNFYVQFVRDQTIERKGRLGADSYTTQTRGIENDTLQKIANDLYDGLVAELLATGIEVVAPEALEAADGFSDVRKAARVSPYTEESSTGGGKRDEKHQGVSILMSAKNLPINVRNTIDEYWLTPNAGDGYKVSLVTAPMKVSKALDVPLLDVRLTVAMAAIKGTVSNSGGTFGSYASGIGYDASSTTFKFEADVFPRFVEGGSMVALVTPKGGTFFTLKTPVVIKGLALSLEKGAGSGSRGAGLLGAIGRSVGGQSKMDADAYIDVQADDLSSKLTARGREITHLLVEAMIR